MHTVTVFKNIREISTPFHRDVALVLERVRNGASKELVKKIRDEKQKADRQSLKKELPSICFSGVFSHREDSALNEHSGLICLDFDGYTKQKELLSDKDIMMKDKYVFSVFISPSGAGLKVLVKIPRDAENHVGYFNSLERHFNNPHFDRTSKNVSRVCYESYDPLIYINKDSLLWDELSEPEYVEVHKGKDKPTIPITDENKIVDILVKWWSKKYPMNEGQRNQNCYILAMALNDFGVNKSLAEFILKQYEDGSFRFDEIKKTIDSAYKNVSNHGTKYYEDEDTVSLIKAKLRRGVTKDEIKSKLPGVSGETIDAVVDKIEESGSGVVFWIKTDKGAVKVVHLLFKQFLEDNGFYKYCPEGGKNYVFVKVTNNLIDHTSEMEIKDFILGYLLNNIDDISVYNYFAGSTSFFKEDFLSMLGTIDIYFVSDSKDAAYLYYKNCAVMVTESEITPIDYLDLGGYVWKDQVINRNFFLCAVTEKCDYKKFIRNICGSDDSRVASMESTIGFMLHGHKNLSFCPAIILNDEVISNNPEGGTGKGLFMNALGHMKKVVTIDGKSFNFERTFAYQLVSADTQILCFDDVKKHFEFERLFSIITEGLTLEKKNKDAIKFPFSRSPKVTITTNYAIRGSGNSFARRKWELELAQHYSLAYTPRDEFGRMMFGDWDEDDWCEFDNYMIGCLQGYLKTGLVKSKFINLKIRQLSAETSHEFIEWCGLVKAEGETKEEPIGVGIRYYKNDLYYNFTEEYPDYGVRGRMSISRTRFYSWITAYSMFKTGVQPDEGRDAQGRWFVIKRAPVVQLKAL